MASPSIRLAMALIWWAYGVLALAIGLFTAIIRWIRPNIGVVIDATVLLGMVGTVVGIVLLSGSALGTYALVRNGALRRPIAVATIVAGWLGGAFVGWQVCSFWANS